MLGEVMYSRVGLHVLFRLLRLRGCCLHKAARVCMPVLIVCDGAISSPAIMYMPLNLQLRKLHNHCA